MPWNRSSEKSRTEDNIVPLITPEGIQIETLQGKKKVLDAAETEITEMIQVVRESEENYAMNKKKLETETSS